MGLALWPWPSGIPSPVAHAYVPWVLSPWSVREPAMLFEPLFERFAQVAEHVRRNYEGMMVGLPPQEWLRFRGLSAQEIAGYLRDWAARVCLAKVRKAKSQPRKKAKARPVHDPNKPHVSTARLLAARRRQN